MRFLILLLLLSSLTSTAQLTDSTKKYVLVIHGGAGTILKENMSPEKERQYRDALTRALQKGYEKLQAGHSSLDAVQAAIITMEDSPLFNAGKGAVFTNEGKNELDASIMDGKSLKAGAVAGVTTIKNPILAARLVMDSTPHVLLAGKGAENFARQKGATMVNPQYFYTPDRWQGLQRIKAQEAAPKKTALYKPQNDDDKFGTVGCVALDKNGNLAAGTSTGGMTNKRFNRIGDSPIIGAGTYANNESVAVSGTGWGEYFIRSVLAYDVHARMVYKGLPVEIAAAEAIDNMG